jgi:hypothetical protein
VLRPQAGLAVVLGVALGLLAGCANLDSSRLFPNSPNGSFIFTPAIGPGPTGPFAPSAGNNYNTPNGP